MLSIKNGGYVIRNYSTEDADKIGKFDNILELAQNVLTEKVIRIIQQFVDGEFVYIPRKSGEQRSQESCITS